MISQRPVSESLQDITDEALLTSLFLPDLSLAGGKTGAAVFFALLALKSNNRHHADLAETLLDRICEELTLHMPTGFAYGLCGIGWSIELLRQRGFLDIDTDSVLHEIDTVITERDVRRVTDLSLESGLKGIAAYVAARLGSRRNPTEPLPFDDEYLSELKKRLTIEGLDSTLREYSIEHIWTEYLNSLDGDNPDLPFWQRGALLLERNDTTALHRDINVGYKTEPSAATPEHKKNLAIILTDECKGKQYGIGTYIRTLLDAIDRNSFMIMTINLLSERLSIEEQDGLITIEIPDIKKIDKSETTADDYELSCFHFITAHMPEAENIVCHFNMYGHLPLIRLFKEHFPASAILSVHYTTCGMELKGDFQQMKYLLKRSPETLSDIEKNILENFYKEKATMEICDEVIAPSSHTIEYMTDLYGISPEKIRKIPHAVRPRPHISDDKSCLRRKFGIPESDTVILYAGRISRDKGVYDLFESMKTLMTELPDLRLIMAGDGEMRKAFRHAAPYLGRITFTGFLQPEDLAGMYRIADIGVVPSHYEEFGYVALEMAYAGLNTVVADAGALPETTQGFDNIFRFRSSDTVSLTDAMRQALRYIKENRTTQRTTKDPYENIRQFRKAINTLYKSRITQTQQ